MEGPLGPMDDEVVDQPPVAIERLGADPGRSGKHVAGPELPDVGPQIRDEGPAAPRAPQLGEAGAPEPAGEAPGPGPSKIRREVAGPQLADPVGVPRPDHQRRGPEQDLAVDSPGQVAPEEGQVR